MYNVVYSFDPRAGHSTDEEVRFETRSRCFSPESRATLYQHDDGEVEARQRVEAIVADMRPLRLRA